MNTDLTRAFPELVAQGYRECSPTSEKYNCIAWAAGQESQWWWPFQHPAYYWPEGIARVVTLDNFIQAFATLGYQVCATEDVETEFEKVALYALDEANACRASTCRWRMDQQARKAH